MYLHFQQNRVSRSVKTDNTNNTNNNCEKKNYFKHALMH